MNTLPYVLRRVYPDGSQEAVSDHPTFGAGWSAGQRAVHEDRENAYALYRGQTNGEERRLAGFGSSRLLPRPKAGRLPAMLGMVA